MTTYYIAPSNRITDRDLVGEGNEFTDLAEAHAACLNINQTISETDGGPYVVVGPSVGGGVQIVES